MLLPYFSCDLRGILSYRRASLLLEIICSFLDVSLDVPSPSFLYSGPNHTGNLLWVSMRWPEWGSRGPYNIFHQNWKHISRLFIRPQTSSSGWWGFPAISAIGLCDHLEKQICLSCWLFSPRIFWRWSSPWNLRPFLYPSL